MQYLFLHPMPAPWLLADFLAILVTLGIVLFVVQQENRRQTYEFLCET
jgi:hypothetical protein